MAEFNPLPYRPARVNPLNPPQQAPGFAREASTAFTLGWFNQMMLRGEGELLHPPEKGFNPWNHMQGYERYAETLLSARSRGEMDWLKALVDFNNREKEIQSRGEYGLVAQFVGSALSDPANLVPIPIARGMGFVKGAAVGAASNMAITAVTDPIRIASDPTADWNEMVYSFGGAALLGAAFGGVAGGVSRANMLKARADFERFDPILSDIEAANLARPFDAAEQNYEVVPGRTGLFEDGRYQGVKIEVVEVPLRDKQGLDGNLYHYDDSFGWVLEADRGRPDPRPVAPEIAEALGMPERTTQNRMVVDEAGLKADFEDGKPFVVREGETPLTREDIRTPQEYVTFKQIEAVWKSRAPKLDDESPLAFRERIQKAALDDLKASRAPSSVARRGLLAPWLDKLNFSPVAKAIRLFAGDNILSDLPLQLAGDYGWAIRANEFGYKTPPSVLVRAMHHTSKFVELRQALDAQWLKFVQPDRKNDGTMVMGQNVTAAMEAMRARAKAMVDGKVMTKRQFAEMAGRAVFESDDFTHEGFPVPPEAREVAKVWTQIAQRYDAQARELGLFYDQSALKRTVMQSDKLIAERREKMAKWLWGGKDQPSKLTPAVKVGDRLFTGKSHDEAITKVMDELGADIEIGPDSYGYVDDPAAQGNEMPGSIMKAAIRVTLEDGAKPREFWAANHMEALMLAEETTGLSMEQIIARGVEDGYITSAGLFVDRTEAGRIAGIDGELTVEKITDMAAARAQASADAPKQPRFRQFDDLVQGRIDSLSPLQRAEYDRWQAELDQLILTRDTAKMQLEGMEATPHTFRDQFGKEEPFFARFWNHTAINADREEFRFLLTEWYKRDNPMGAEQRAEKTIDDMLKAGDGEDEASGTIPGLPHLMQRRLNIPNSFKATHPTMGEIRLSKFFNTDIEVVGEAYIRGMGHKIEAAKMFGDASLWAKKGEMTQYFRERYIFPAIDKGKSKAEIDALWASFDEYMGWVDLTSKAVLGGLKTRDPWAFDNRMARNLKNYQVLTSMGRVLLTSIPEAMRVPMVNGFATAFRSIWVRAFSDFETIRANVELARETGEMADLIKDVHMARIMETNQPDPGGGGTYIEKWLERRVPGFLKLVGQTHWTVMLKDLTMFSAQHKVMKLAQNIDEGNNAFKLAAIGIGKADARLLASMPVQSHGSLILPAVQNWTGADGRRARQLLLEAIHAEARRAIVTPSLADKSLLFSGIAARKGKVMEIGGKPMESDLMSVPLQFMSYGIAANQKVLMSMLQGRDQNAVMGAFGLLVLAAFSNYMKQPQTATMNKTPEEWLIEAYESSGIGGFWFADLNQMIERYSMNTAGIRPLTGTDPRFGKTTGVGDLWDLGGPSAGTVADVFAAFLDPDKTATNRAQAIRRAVPYNNVIWWGGMTRDLATAAGKSFQE